jgi:hypothetical protein
MIIVDMLFHRMFVCFVVLSKSQKVSFLGTGNFPGIMGVRQGTMFSLVCSYMRSAHACMKWRCHLDVMHHLTPTKGVELTQKKWTGDGKRLRKSWVLAAS